MTISANSAQTDVRLEPTESDSSAPRGVRKALVWLVALVALSWLVNLARLDRLTGDQFTLLSVVQYEQDPARFKRDGLFKDPSWYRGYLPWYRALTKQLVTWTGDGPLAMWLMSGMLTLLMAVSFWLCFYWLKVDPMLATAGALLAILPRVATGSELTGAAILECALPRTFFSVGLPLVLLILLRSKLRGPGCVAGFLALGLLGNFHPQSAFFATGGLLLVLLARGWREWRSWLLAPACGLAAVVGVLPFSLNYPWESSAPLTASKAEQDSGESLTRLEALGQMMVSRANPVVEPPPTEQPVETDPSVWELAATEEHFVAMESAAEVDEMADDNDDAADEHALATSSATSLDDQDPQESAFRQVWLYSAALKKYILKSINYQVTIPTLLLAVFPLILGVRLLRPLLPAEPSSQWMAAQILYSTAFIITGLAIAGELFNSVLGFHRASIPFLDSVQPLRATRLTAPLAVCALVLMLASTRQRWAFNQPRLRWAIGCMLFPVLVTLTAGEYVFQTRYKPVREAARWAEQHTAEDALFLLDPPGAVAFRVWANRPVVWSRHDAVCVSGPLKSKARREIRQLERAFQKQQLGHLRELGKSHRANYLLYPFSIDVEENQPTNQSGPFLSLSKSGMKLRTANSPDAPSHSPKF